MLYSFFFSSYIHFKYVSSLAGSALVGCARARAFEWKYLGGIGYIRFYFQWVNGAACFASIRSCEDRCCKASNDLMTGFLFYRYTKSTGHSAITAKYNQQFVMEQHLTQSQWNRKYFNVHMWTLSMVCLWLVFHWQYQFGLLLVDWLSSDIGIEEMAIELVICYIQSNIFFQAWANGNLQIVNVCLSIGCTSQSTGLAENTTLNDSQMWFKRFCIEHSSVLFIPNAHHKYPHENDLGLLV